jgi:hypothetical protein
MRLVLGAIVLISAVAALDAARGSHWDQLAMLLVVGSLAVAGLVMSAWLGNAVRLRPDVMAWVKQQAALTDDEPRLLVDRAIAAYRAQMLPDAEDPRQ